MQTDDDAARPEKYCRNRIASIGQDKVDEEQECKDVKEEDNDE
jgi:hypothetical protein